ncbi:MAG: DUF6766 family protein [Opitutaceae bacterium]
MKRFFRHNSLSLVLLVLFAATLFGGQYLAGFRVHNDELRRHGQMGLSHRDYLFSAHFAEATFENWESEFFQMGVFVYLTVFFFQKGSAESNDPDERAGKGARKPNSRSPWPVRKGGWWLRLYEHSLSLTLLGLFIACFIGHVLSGARLENQQRALQGEASQRVGEFICSSQFWFESFQNWQSEFLSIAAMVLLTVVLREKGSPESKDVATPHAEHD